MLTALYVVGRAPPRGVRSLVARMIPAPWAVITALAGTSVLCFGFAAYSDVEFMTPAASLLQHGAPR